MQPFVQFTCKGPVAVNLKKILISILFLLLGLIVIGFVIKSFPSKEEIRAKEIIQSFKKAYQIDIKAGTDENKIFMRKIVWGEYPDLTGEESKFINSPNELIYVYAYAWKYSGYKDLYGDYYNNIDLKEAIKPTSTE